MATPSLAMIPCGRKATKLYSVLPTDGTGDFTVARASQGSEINSDLKIQNVANNVPRFTYDTLGGCPSLLTEPQSTNLITYPVSFGNNYWTKSGATIEGDASTAGAEIITGGLELTNGSAWDFNFGAVTFSGAGASFNANDDRLVETTLLTVGQLYLCEIDITTNTATSFNIDNNGFPIYKSSTTTGVQSFYFTASSASFRIIQIGAGAVDVASLSVKEVQGFSSPHVDYPTSAFKLVEGTSSAQHRMVSGVAVTTGLKYTASVYVKDLSGNRKIQLNHDQAGINSYFDLSTLEITNILGVGKYTILSNGWYRFEVTGTATSTGTFGNYIALANPTETYTGDGTSGVYIFMAQAEESSVATSPTFTDITLASEGSTTTRLADVVNKTGVSSIIGQTEGTIFLNIKRGVQINNTQGLFGISSPSGDNRIIIWNIFTLNSLGIQIKANNANVITSQSLGVFNNGENYKIAVSYKSGEIKGYVNGLQIFNLTNTFTFTSALSEIYLNNYANNSFTEISPINELQIYNTALTDAELISLTSL